MCYKIKSLGTDHLLKSKIATKVFNLIIYIANETPPYHIYVTIYNDQLCQPYIYITETTFTRTIFYYKTFTAMNCRIYDFIRNIPYF